MYIAMRGSERIVEGDNLDQVVIAAEAYARPGTGDIIVWKDNKFIAAEIEDQGDNPEPYTTYRSLSHRVRESHLG